MIIKVIEAYKVAAEKYPKKLKSWEIIGQAKIVLKAQNEKQLKEIYNKAIENDIPASLIEDDGLTQIKSGSLTCCAIGPGKIHFNFFIILDRIISIKAK